MNNTKHYVFVYGTLKKGEPNHHWFGECNDENYKFLCNAETTEKYPLIVATKYNVPFLLFEPGIGNYVKGEVYKVSDATLANLDVLEEHPTFYIREEHPVKCFNIVQENLMVWIYFIKTFNKDLLNLPLLENYSNKNQKHPYVFRDRSKKEDLL